MIGHQQNLSPGQSAWKAKPVADLSGIARPRKVSDSETQDAGQAAYESKLRDGQTAYTDTIQARDGKGFSEVGPNAMFAAQQQSQAASEGAQARAGIEAEDQMFNAGQDAMYRGRVIGRLNSDFANRMKASNAYSSYDMARKQGKWDYAKNRQQNWNQLRLSMLSKLS
jgi:hypothetical protein